MMFKIFVHWPCLDNFMDKDICLPIEMPFVPSIGDSISLPREEYAHLEKTVNQDSSLRVRYKRWLYPDHITRGSTECLFVDADIVIGRIWRHKTKEIHIELGADIKERENYADSYY